MFYLIDPCSLQVEGQAKPSPCTILCVGQCAKLLHDPLYGVVRV